MGIITARDKVCWRCRFFESLLGQYRGQMRGDGECHYCPPPEVDRYGYGVFPGVAEESWCGKWERQDKKPPEND